MVRASAVPTLRETRASVATNVPLRRRQRSRAARSRRVPRWRRSRERCLADRPVRLSEAAPDAESDTAFAASGGGAAFGQPRLPLGGCLPSPRSMTCIGHGRLLTGSRPSGGPSGRPTRGPSASGQADRLEPCPRGFGLSACFVIPHGIGTGIAWAARRRTKELCVGTTHSKTQTQPVANPG